MRVHARQGDTVDAICWRHLGRTAGIVEHVIDGHRGLADHGPFLPQGTAVDLPDPIDAPRATLALIQLWD